MRWTPPPPFPPMSASYFLFFMVDASPRQLSWIVFARGDGGTGCKGVDSVRLAGRHTMRPNVS